MHDLGTLGGNFSTGEDINNYGWVAGTTLRADGSRTAFLYDGSTMRDLGALFPSTTQGFNIGGSFGYAINDAGHVGGTLEINGDRGYHAFVYDTSLHDLNDDQLFTEAKVVRMNSAGQAVGDDNCCWAFLHDGQTSTLVYGSEYDPSVPSTSISTGTPCSPLTASTTWEEAHHWCIATASDTG